MASSIHIYIYTYMYISSQDMARPATSSNQATMQALPACWCWCGIWSRGVQHLWNQSVIFLGVCRLLNTIICYHVLPLFFWVHYWRWLVNVSWFCSTCHLTVLFKGHFSRVPGEYRHTIIPMATLGEKKSPNVHIRCRPVHLACFQIYCSGWLLCSWETRFVVPYGSPCL